MIQVASSQDPDISSQPELDRRWCEVEAILCCSESNPYGPAGGKLGHLKKVKAGDLIHVLDTPYKERPPRVSYGVLMVPYLRSEWRTRTA